MPKAGVPESGTRQAVAGDEEPESAKPVRLGVDWLGSSQSTLGEFADDVERLLRQLVTLHPVFDELYIIGRSRRDSPALGDDLSSLQPWIMRRSWHEKPSTRSPYSHVQADGSLTAQSRGNMGFSVSIGNLKYPDELRIDVRGGGRSNGGGLGITLPLSMTAELCRIDFIRRLLGVLVNVWPVRYALLKTLAWDDQVNPLPESGGNLRIGGITYSNDGTLIDALPQGVPWERFGASGVLFTITERPDLAGAATIAKAIEIRDALEASGKLRLSSQPSTLSP